MSSLSSGAESAPELLPGPSSMRLILRGMRIMLGSTALGLGFAFESRLGRYESLYIAVLACLAFGGIVLGFAIRVVGMRKQDLEIERGYTCKKAIALRDPALYAVDYKTGAVIARPHEGR